MLLRTIQSIYPLLIICYMSMGGLLCLFAIQSYIGSAGTPLIYLICASIMIGVYVLNRYTDSLEDFANNIETYVYFSKHQLFLWLGIGLLLFAMISLIITERLNYFHLILLGIGIGYSIQIVPWIENGQLKLYRFKEIPFIKNISVATAWGISLFIIPISFSGSEVALPRNLWILCVSCIILVFNNTMFSDIRDIPGDKLANAKTLPILFGETKCILFLITLNFLWSNYLLIVFYLGLINASHYAFLLLICHFPTIYIFASTRKEASSKLITVLSESDLLIYAIGLYLLS